MNEPERPEPQDNFEELFERSKDDHAMIVGSEIRYVIGRARLAEQQRAAWEKRANEAEAALASCREERDRVQAALQQTKGALEFAYESNRVAEAAMISDALTTIDAALKPVSDRQPEGETK